MYSPPQPRLRFHPVVVGINTYQSPRIPSLDFAVRDAQRVTHFLRSDNPAFTTVDFEPLLNERATAAQVREQIHAHWMSYRLGAGDVVLLYFAGHGDIFRDKAYLFCYDTNPSDPDSGGLRLDDLFRSMADVTAHAVMVVLDSCHSGAIVAPEIVNINFSDQMRRLLTTWAFPTGHNSVILAAAHATQKARENAFLKTPDTPDGQGGGVFTNSLLKGWWEGEARDSNAGIVTPELLAHYLSQQFQVAPGQNASQQPISAVTCSTPLVIGRFESTSSAPPVSKREYTTPRPTWGDVVQGDNVLRPPLPPDSASSKLIRRRFLIAGVVAFAAVALCGTLTIISPLIFTLAYVLVCLTAVGSIAVAGRATRFAIFLAVLQGVLLIGVAHLHFGLGAGFSPLDILAQYSWGAIILFGVQALIILYRVTESITSS